MTSQVKTWALGAAMLAIATGGIVAACHNAVPAHTLPAPAREVEPLAERPDIHFETGDAGVPEPPERRSQIAYLAQEIPADADFEDAIDPPHDEVDAGAGEDGAVAGEDAAAPPPPPAELDAGVPDDVLDLPPLFDADIPIVTDAAQPLE